MQLFSQIFLIFKVNINEDSKAKTTGSQITQKNLEVLVVQIEQCLIFEIYWKILGKSCS